MAVEGDDGMKQSAKRLSERKFAGAYLKLLWAKMHLQQLHSFHIQNQERFAEELINSAGVVGSELRFSCNVPMTPEYPLFTGDILHSLRSALDNLAAGAMIEKQGDKADIRGYFPSGQDKQSLKNNDTFKKFKRDAPEYIPIIEAAQPYWGQQNNDFTQLNELNNKDKHRLIIMQAFEVSLWNVSWVLTNGARAQNMSFTFAANKMWAPFTSRDGAKLASISIESARFDPFFEEEVAPHQLLMPTLERLFKVVEMIIEAFESQDPGLIDYKAL